MVAGKAAAVAVEADGKAVVAVEVVAGKAVPVDGTK